MDANPSSAPATAVAAPLGSALAVRPHRSNTRRAWQRFRASKLALAALVVAVFMVLVALGADIITARLLHQSPNSQSLLHNFEPTSRTHWLGTDEVGRDVAARIIYGARVSLGVAFLSVTVAITIGTLIGLLAGFFGGWVDTILMRFVDLMLSIPSFILLLLIATLLRVSPIKLALIIAFLSWFGLSRLIRSEVLSLRRREYVEAARVIGASNGRILGQHILPNVSHLIIVFATGAVPNVILQEASISFLGVGIQPPTASWGNMLTNATNYFTKAGGLVVFPGIATALTVLSLTIVGYALRDALDPRLTR